MYINILIKNRESSLVVHHSFKKKRFSSSARVQCQEVRIISYIYLLIVYRYFPLLYQLTPNQEHHDQPNQKETFRKPSFLLFGFHLFYNIK